MTHISKHNITKDKKQTLPIEIFKKKRMII